MPGRKIKIGQHSHAAAGHQQTTDVITDVIISRVVSIRMMAAIYLKAAAKFLQLSSASAWIDGENG